MIILVLYHLKSPQLSYFFLVLIKSTPTLDDGLYCGTVIVCSIANMLSVLRSLCVYSTLYVSAYSRAHAITNPRCLRTEKKTISVNDKNPIYQICMAGKNLWILKHFRPLGAVHISFPSYDSKNVEFFLFNLNYQGNRVHFLGRKCLQLSWSNSKQ